MFLLLSNIPPPPPPPRMPCISQATRTRTMCRQSLIAVRWSARPSTTTWCVNGGPAPTWTTCSTRLEPTNQQPGSWSVSTVWPLCPSSAGWREIQIFTQSGVPDCSGDRSFSTEDRVVGEGVPRQRALALRIDLPPCCERWSEPPGKKKKLTVLALSGISSGERSNPCMIKPRFLQCRLGFLVATRADSLPCGWNNGASCLCGSVTKEQEPRTSALWSTVVYKRYGGGGLSFESRRD